MKHLVKIASAGLLAMVVHSPANAATVAYVGSGTFGLTGTGNNCSGCSVSNNGGSPILDMSGNNNSTLEAARITNPGVSTDTNNSIVGQLVWVNRASTGSDQNFNVNYTFSLAFSLPNSSSDTQLFNINIQQLTNDAGDEIFHLSNTTLANLGPFSLNGVTVSDLHFALASGSGGTYNSATGEWDNPDPSNSFSSRTSTLNIVADFTATVPEPSTWAMMILGFMGVGFMAYRRKSSFRLA